LSLLPKRKTIGMIETAGGFTIIARSLGDVIQALESLKGE
jgi:hypothetical protein